MANEEQLSILKQGVEVWNEWRKKNLNARIDLKYADLSNVNLREANLIGAHLGSANLRGSNLVAANLTEAILGDANLKEANLSGATLLLVNLVLADLRRAILRNSILSLAIFQRTRLFNSDFTNASIKGTIFGDLDLSHIVGLETITHSGPSHIDIKTLKKSKGKIPVDFLRGCGLSNFEIEYSKVYNPELSPQEIDQIFDRTHKLRDQQPRQTSDLFISYSHVDSAFVGKLESYLTNKGIRYWRDTHEMKAGRIEKQIDRAIHQNSTVLLVLSESSIQSDWVEHEVRKARELEKELSRDTLCPVALDYSWKESRWPKRVMEQIMEYNILDFSEWQDDSKFDVMFRRLIDGLELFYKG